MVPVRAGDRLLFCSDGLCGLVDDQLIEECLLTRDRDHALARLVKEALAEGGIDNITIILADVAEAEPDPAVAVPAESEGVVLGAAAERAIPAAATKLRAGGRGHDRHRPPAADRRRARGRADTTYRRVGGACPSAVGVPSCCWSWRGRQHRVRLDRTQYFVGVAGTGRLYQGLSGGWESSGPASGRSSRSPS
jgi:hypothetical protein